MSDESPAMEVEQAATVFSGILAREKAAPAVEKPKAAPEPKQAAPKERAASQETPPAKVDEPDNGQTDDADDVEIDDRGDEPESDNASAIEPPKSMPAELRAKFAALPVEYQEFLVARERDVANGGEKITGKAKAAEAELKAATQRYEQALQQLTQQSARHRDPDIVRFENEFKDVIEGKTDLAKLAEEDLGRYMQFTAMRDKAIAAHGRETAMREEAAKTQQANLAKFRNEQNEQLKELIPALKDTKKFAEFDTKVTKALREIGIPDEQILGATAKALALAYDGVRYRDAVAKAKTAEAKPAPSIQKPGTAERRNGKAEATAADLNRLRKSGRVEDAAKVFGRLLGT